MPLFAETADAAVFAGLAVWCRDLIGRIETRGLRPDHLPEIDAPGQSKRGSVIAILQNPLIDVSDRRMINHLWQLRLDRKAISPITQRAARTNRASASLHKPQRRCRNAGAATQMPPGPHC